jgi:DNA-directed RNA polymerase subunit RPC12/RpoP
VLAVNCPQCGAEAPLALQSDAIRCPYCGHHGPLPAAVAQQLEQARQLLFSLDVHARQLDARERRAVASSHGSRALLLAATLAGALPVALATLLLVAMALLTSSWMGLFWWGALLFAILLTVWAVLRARQRLHTRVRALTLACAATPPRAPGEPASCHVCGSPIASDVEAVVRCGYCQSDNIVATDVLAAAKQHRQGTLTDFASAVQQQASSVTAAGRLGAVGIVGTGCMGPVLGLGLSFLSAISVAMCGPELSADDRRYALIERDARRCYAEVQESDGRFTLSWSDGYKEVATLDDLKLVEASHIVGKRVRDTDGSSGEALRVVGDYFMDGNEAVIKWDGELAVESPVHVSHLCLEP